MPKNGTSAPPGGTYAPPAGYGKALQLDPNNSVAHEGLARAEKAKAAEDALK
jgi:hypothetical protein